MVLGLHPIKKSKRHAALGWPSCGRVALGLLPARIQCYFGSCPARPKASCGPSLAVPTSKRHLALGLQRRGNRPSATWRLGCPPSGGNPSAECPNVVYFIVIAVFKNLLMMIIIFIVL